MGKDEKRNSLPYYFFQFLFGCGRLTFAGVYTNGKKKNLIKLLFVKNLNFVAGMTRRFVSAKRLIRYFSNSSKLVEHRAQSPVREVKMLAVWPSIAEGFPTAKFTS